VLEEPVTNHYRAGRRVEIMVADQLGAHGYDVILSSVSKGAADLFALHDGEILYVQVKKSKHMEVTPAERRELLRLRDRTGKQAHAIVAHRQPHPENARRVVTVYRELTGPGPREYLPWIPRNELEGLDVDGIS
jgi:Holliday junction resolvase